MHGPQFYASQFLFAGGRGPKASQFSVHGFRSLLQQILQLFYHMSLCYSVLQINENFYLAPGACALIFVVYLLHIETKDSSERRLFLVKASQQDLR